MVATYNGGRSAMKHAADRLLTMLLKPLGPVGKMQKSFRQIKLFEGSVLLFQ